MLTSYTINRTYKENLIFSRAASPNMECCRRPSLRTHTLPRTNTESNYFYMHMNGTHNTHKKRT